VEIDEVIVKVREVDGKGAGLILHAWASIGSKAAAAREAAINPLIEFWIF